MKITDFEMEGDSTSKVVTVIDPPLTEEAFAFVQNILSQPQLNLPRVEFRDGKLVLWSPHVWALESHMKAIQIALDRAEQQVQKLRDNANEERERFLNSFRKAAGLSMK